MPLRPAPDGRPPAALPQSQRHGWATGRALPRKLHTPRSWLSLWALQLDEGGLVDRHTQRDMQYLIECLASVCVFAYAYFNALKLARLRLHNKGPVLPKISLPLITIHTATRVDGRRRPHQSDEAFILVQSEHCTRMRPAGIT